MIKLTALRKLYRTAEIETVALRDIDLDVQWGEYVAIMGPSGCGKSTLLNIIAMIDTPTAGEYWFGDRNVAKCAGRDLTILRKRAIGFVFQSFNLIDELNVFENVELALLYHRDVSAKDRKARVSEALERVRMAHRARHLPQQLSGGQQQRVAVARAVVSRPRVVLADEPTGNLDSANGEEVMQILGQLNSQGTTIIVVTHSDSCAQHASRVVRLLDGAVVSQSTRATTI